MTAKTYPVPDGWSSSACINEEKYRAMYEQSVRDPDGFWGEQAGRVDWIKPFTKVKNTSFDPHNVSIKWYEDGTLNVCANCVDRHLEKRGDQVAIVWEGDEPNMDQKITYRQLHERVSRFANVLKKHGVKKGDRVTIYLPMIPEATYAMLACARIGAIHSVVFGGFSPDSLASRIVDCDSNVLITADEGIRGGRKVPLKANADKALEKCPTVERVLVVKRTNSTVGWKAGRDYWLAEEMLSVSADCPPEEMSAEDPLFILYTSGSTGQPKGVLHTSGGYLVYRIAYAPIRVRLQGRRHLLVHRRRRLGHRPQLYRLWAARQWRDHGDVRGRAELSYRVAVLGRRRQAQGEYLLHRADRDPRADGSRRRARQKDEPQVAQAARQRRRADQSRSLGVVLPRRGRGALPNRRHLVADRDRRHSDHAAARRDRPETGLGDAAVLRRAAGAHVARGPAHGGSGRGQSRAD